MLSPFDLEQATIRQVIFVAGTSYSGSTFFHMILGNDPAGFAVGELRWLFNPLREYHATMTCSCNDVSCKLWQSIRARGEQQLFSSIFESRPETRFIVDSSKSVFWIRQQADQLKRQGIASRHILIWKSPAQLRESMSRRNRESEWEKIWINYHLLYFSLIKDWRAVPYSDFVSDPAVMTSVCDWLSIPYFDRKEEYWNRTHHIFGGNQTSRFHLYQGTKAEQEIENSFDNDRMHRHRQIYNSTENVVDLDSRALFSPRNQATAEKILDALKNHDVRSSTVEPPGVEMSAVSRVARSIKHSLTHQYGRLRLARPTRLSSRLP